MANTRKIFQVLANPWMSYKKKQGVRTSSSTQHASHFSHDYLLPGHLHLNMALTFPMIISFQVISKAHNTESKTPYISGRILWKAFPKGPHFLRTCSFELFNLLLPTPSFFAHPHDRGFITQPVRSEFFSLSPKS